MIDFNRTIEKATRRAKYNGLEVYRRSVARIDEERRKLPPVTFIDYTGESRSQLATLPTERCREIVREEIRAATVRAEARKEPK